MTGVSERLDAIEARWGDNPRDDVPYLLGLVRKYQMALESAEALKLDPSTKHHTSLHRGIQRRDH